MKLFPDFRDSMSRVTRTNFGISRLLRPLSSFLKLQDLISGLSRLKFSAMQFVSGLRSGATHCVILLPDFPDSNSQLDYAICVWILIRRDALRNFMTRFSRLKLRARLCILGLDADAARRTARLYVQTFQTQKSGHKI